MLQCVFTLITYPSVQRLEHFILCIHRIGRVPTNDSPPKAHVLGTTHLTGFEIPARLGILTILRLVCGWNCVSQSTSHAFSLVCPT